MKRVVVIILLLGVGGFFGYLTKFKGLGESVSWWLLCGAAIFIVILAYEILFADECSNRKEPMKSVVNLGMAAVIISAAAFTAMWFQPESVQTYKYAMIFVAAVVSVIPVARYFDEAFSSRK